MKRIASLAVVLALAACSTTQPVAQAPAPKPVYASPAEAAAQKVIDNVPEWFVDVPKQENVIYAVGDGVSGSLSGAIGNARANAFEGICQAAGGKVRSQTKVYRQDTEAASTSVTTTAIRNICPDVDVTGANVEKRHVVRDGNRFRAYVLVALPVGEKNTLARTKQMDKLQERAMANREREFKELDNIVDGKAEPASKVEGITLMPVDNEEYKRKRDDALQKPGAVIGQTVVR
jgi:formiminotetrahydrofolate cyclodeaminase